MEPTLLYEDCLGDEVLAEQSALEKEEDERLEHTTGASLVPGAGRHSSTSSSALPF